ncbi:hypothetical protein HPP92_012093 [Vanilla planifolia]|uniref:Uncharacterized protein n=1 Tax=Vanilla planifolia TaxID=51239 RepID=A0A835QWX6_VANPL|nr:hypothetical protein HPP92_012093 [Vanilla planifolia]
MEVTRRTARKLSMRMSTFGDATEVSEAIAEIPSSQSTTPRSVYPSRKPALYLFSLETKTTEGKRENAVAALLNLEISEGEAAVPEIPKPGLGDCRHSKPLKTCGKRFSI